MKNAAASSAGQPLTATDPLTLTAEKSAEWLGLSRHSDGGHAAGDPMHIKIAFYLDPLTADSGSLRVIPGSHRIGDAYATALNDAALREPGIGGAEVPAVAFETVAGDVVVFNHNTKHASFNGGGRRRMFTLNACQKCASHSPKVLKLPPLTF